jgi:hypothetical protein
MKPIETYPDKDRCELCGAVKTDKGTDPRPERSGVEVIRRLAFIADTAPSLAILLVHHIAGRTEREIAGKLRRPQSTIHDQISKARKVIRSIPQS